jgi:hypothetical protein
VVNLPSRLLLTARLTALTAMSASKLYLCWRLATAAQPSTLSLFDQGLQRLRGEGYGRIGVGCLGGSILRDMLIIDVGMKGQATNGAVNHKVNARY